MKSTKIGSSNLKTTCGSADVFLAAIHLLIYCLGIISIFYYVLLFPTSFRGWPEITPYKSVAGWIVNEAAPQQSAEVELYVDDRFVAHKTADISRPDVVAAGRARTDNCGFDFDLRPLLLEPGTHVAQIYAVHKAFTTPYRTLQRIGEPLSFQVP